MASMERIAKEMLGKAIKDSPEVVDAQSAQARVEKAMRLAHEYGKVTDGSSGLYFPLRFIHFALGDGAYAHPDIALPEAHRQIAGEVHDTQQMLASKQRAMTARIELTGDMEPTFRAVWLGRVKKPNADKRWCKTEPGPDDTVRVAMMTPVQNVHRSSDRERGYCGDGRDLRPVGGFMLDVYGFTLSPEGVQPTDAFWPRLCVGEQQLRTALDVKNYSELELAHFNAAIRHYRRTVQ